MPRSHILVSLLLRTLREDPNAVVRHEAAFVLGRVHDLHSDLVGDEVFLALCKSARTDSSIIVRHEATEVLGNLADPRVSSAA
jgi:HEAT repeat protein